MKISYCKWQIACNRKYGPFMTLGVAFKRWRGLSRDKEAMMNDDDKGMVND